MSRAEQQRFNTAMIAVANPHKCVAVPENELIELQLKAKLVDELLYVLEQTRIDVFYYGNADFNKTLKAIDKAIEKAKGE